MAYKLFWLALAGCFGTLARYSLAGWVYQFTGAAFPWGTAAVNISGCLLAGILWGLFEQRWAVSGEIRAAILVGFMGAFTTFSTMVLETMELVRVGQWFAAIANLSLQNAVGLFAFWLAVSLARSW